MAITKVSRGLLSTGISDSSDATAITIDSSERVGIGTTSPASPLHVVGGASLGSGFTQTRSGHPSFGITNGNTDTVYFSIAPDGGSHQSFMEVVDDDTDVDSIKFVTSGSTRMAIASDGKVGIGTESPTSKLHIFNSSGNSASFMQTTNSGSSATTNYQTPNRIFYTGIDIGGVNSAYTIYDGTAGSERMRINYLGDILCGMTSASYLAAQDGIQIKKAGNIRIGGNGTAARNVMAFVNGTDGTPAQVGYIQTSGSGTAFGTTSDYRLKENVNYEFDALSRVKQLKPARFNFIVDADKIVDGFLAHEVSDIVPEAISGTKDAVDDEGNPEYQGIDQSKLVPLLTKAIQEQQDIIDDLKTRIEVLEA